MQAKTLVFEKQTEGIQAKFPYPTLPFSSESSFFYRKDKQSKGVYLLKKKMNENRLNTIPANLG